MNLEKLITELEKSGITAENITVCKNGCECLGIRIINPESPNISPIIYYSPDETMESIISRVIAIKELEAPDVDAECLCDPAYVSRNVYISIQKVCEDEDADVLKRPCLNLELVLRLAVTLGDSTGSIRMTRSLLARCDMGEDALWAIAMENMKGRYRTVSITEALDLPETLFGDNPFFVCTTDSRTNGASVLAFPDIFRRFCEDKGCEKIFVLPSSTEEVLIIPASAVNDGHLLAEMVRDVNATCVDPLVQLEPSVYMYDAGTNQLTIAAIA